MKRFNFFEVMFILLVVAILVTGVMCYAVKAETVNVIESSLIMQRGNTKGIETLSAISHENISKNDRFKLGLEYRYSANDDEKDGENIKLYEKFEKDISKSIFWTFDGEFEYDYASDLQRRIVCSPGIGTNLLDDDTMKFSLDAGISYAVEKYEGITLDDRVLLRGRQRFELKIADGVRLNEEVEFFPEIDNLDNYRIESNVSVFVDVTKSIEFKCSLEDRYKNHVAKGLERNEMIVSAGVRYLF